MTHGSRTLNHFVVWARAIPVVPATITKFHKLIKIHSMDIDHLIMMLI